jgi:hypothetical protein
MSNFDLDNISRRVIMAAAMTRRSLSRLAFVLLIAASPARGAVSYLLIQGEFDSSHAGLETSRWAVTYDPAVLTTSQDLLDRVFGTPKLVSGTTDRYETDPTSWAADGSTWKVSYKNDASYGLFVDHFIRNNVALNSNFGSNLGWNLDVAGGGGFSGSDYSGADYASGIWTYSNDGSGSRTLANNSIDAWVYGDTGTYSTVDPYPLLTPPVAVTGFSAAPSSFSGAGVNVVSSAAPEPSRVLLLMIGLIVPSFRRRR